VSLLARLERASDPHSTERYSHRDTDLESAIASHLTQMLNTRQGSCITCPDYGLIEVSEVLYDFPDAVGIMQRALKTSIQQYEPRLKNVQVRHLKGDDTSQLTLQFEIAGQVHLPDGRRQALRLATSVDPSGSVTIV
jgi:type VI secretion system protein